MFKKIEFLYKYSRVVLLLNLFINTSNKIAFFVFYNFIKFFKNYKNIDKIDLHFFLKNFFIRYMIILISFIPYSIFKANTFFIRKLFILKNYNYSSYNVYILTLLFNVINDITYDISLVIYNFRIIYEGDIIIINPVKKPLSNLKDIKSFWYANKIIKKNSNLVWMRVKQSSHNKKFNFRRPHLTFLMNLDNKNVIYNNETSQQKLKFFNIETQKFEFTKLKYFHEGSINLNKSCFYTPNIITDKSNLIIEDPRLIINQHIKFEIAKSNLSLSFLLNSDESCLEQFFVDDKSDIIQSRNLSSLLTMINENSKDFDFELKEAVLATKDFLEKNQDILNLISEEERSFFIIKSLYIESLDIKHVIFWALEKKD